MSALPEPAPAVADGVERSLDPRYVSLQRAASWIFWACASAVSMIAVPVIIFALRPRGWVTALVAGGALALSASLAWVAHVWPALEHRHARYRVDDVGIEIRRGVLWRHAVQVARSRVQHTDVSQGPLERRFRLATLQIFTAGTDHAQVSLPGLDFATALSVRDHLLAGRTDDAV